MGGFQRGELRRGYHLRHRCLESRRSEASAVVSVLDDQHIATAQFSIDVRQQGAAFTNVCGNRILGETRATRIHT